MTPSDLPEDLRFDYRFHVAPWDKERHDWSLIGDKGAISIWAKPGSGSAFSYRWYGGIEVHYASEPHHADYCGNQEHCWLLDGPCWTDGSSLQFSEEVAPMLPDPSGEPLSGQTARLLLPILIDRYEAWLASVDTLPKGGDAKQAPCASKGSAVPNASEGDAQ